jgi:hypothetical protein
VRISRIARPHLLHAKADGTYADFIQTDAP